MLFKVRVVERDIFYKVGDILQVYGFYGENLEAEFITYLPGGYTFYHIKVKKCAPYNG